MRAARRSASCAPAEARPPSNEGFCSPAAKSALICLTAKRSTRGNSLRPMDVLRHRRVRANGSRAVRLSEKELSVLRELARGRQTDDIAQAFVVSPHTVRTHVKNSMK